MDPLSIAASVAGIITAAASVTNALSPYISAVKHTPPIALKIRSELVNTQIILGALQTLLNDLNTSPASRANLIDIDHLVIVFTDGVLIFSELEAAVSSIRPANGTLTTLPKLSWTRKEGHFKSIAERLGSFKDSVLLLLNILQCNSDFQASKNRKALHNKIDSLLDRDQQLATRVSDVKDPFDGLSLLRRASKPGTETATAGAPSITDSDIDSFYSAVTQRIAASPVEASPLSPSVAMDTIATLELPTFTFEPDLERSRVYKRSHIDRSNLPSGASNVLSNSWSIFSGITLSEISVLTAIALPLCSKDITNSQHYEFVRNEFPRGLLSRHVKSNRTTLGALRNPFLRSEIAWDSTDERTMGPWAATRQRIVRPREFRFEVTFQVPVLFLARPDYDGYGPVRDEPIIWLFGDAESRALSFTELEEPRFDSEMRLSKALRRTEKSARRSREVVMLRTAERQRATWVTLLMIIQDMESQSMSWLNQTIQKESSFPKSHIGTLEKQTNAWKSRTLGIAIQKKRKSWDSMPASFSKPYVITTWTYIIEIAAMLGIYWIAFDRNKGVYLAVGNGFNLTSEVLPDLGVVIYFQVTGNNWFQERRVIPTEAIRDLAFGQLRTIFDDHETVSGNIGRTTEPNLCFLRFGSTEEIIQSLMVLGCNSWTTQSFSSHRGRDLQISQKELHGSRMRVYIA